MKTCWNKIKVIESELAAQNPTLFIKLLHELASQNMLTKDMLHGVAHSTFEQEKIWDVIHTFADKEIQ